MSDRNGGEMSQKTATKAAKRRRKLPISVLIPILTVIFATSVMIMAYEIAYKQATARTSDSLYSSAVDQVDRIMTQTDSQFESLSVFARLASAAFDEHGILDTKRALSSMQNAMSAIDYDKLSVIDGDGNAVYLGGSKNSVADRGYFISAINGDSCLSRVPESKIDGKIKFVIAVPVYDKNGQIVGAVSGSYGEETFMKLMEVGNRNEGGYSYICDKYGDVVVRSSAENYHNVSNLFYDQNESGSKVAEFISLTEEQVRSDLANGGSNLLRYKIDGDERSAVYMPIGINEWYLFSVVPQSVIADEVMSLMVSSITLIAIAILSTGTIFLILVVQERRNMKRAVKEREQILFEQERFDMVYANTTISVWEYDMKRRRIIQTPRSASVHGFTETIDNVPESLVESKYVHPDYAESFMSMYRRMFAGEQNVSGVFCVQNAERTIYWYEYIRYKVLFDEQGRPTRAIGMSEDVTELREKEMAYERWQQDYATMKPDSVIYYEFNLSQDKCESGEGNVEWLIDEKCGGKFSSMCKLWHNEFVHGEDKQRFGSIMDRSKLLTEYNEGHPEHSLEFRLLSGKNYIWVRMMLTLVAFPYTSDIKLYMVVSDIDSEKHEELKLQSRATEDPLTGLLNRATFVEKVNTVLSEDAELHHAIIMIDIDGFKRINDTFGHVEGDKFIVRISQCLKSLLRPNDLLARIGGDEFMMLMRGIPNAEVARKRAALVRNLLRFDLNNDVTVSASIGVAMYPENGKSFEELYKNSDAAMYHAKGSGKDGFLFYESSMAMSPENSSGCTPIDFVGASLANVGELPDDASVPDAVRAAQTALTEHAVMTAHLNDTRTGIETEEQTRHRQEIIEAVDHDRLTGLYSRHGFSKRLKGFVNSQPDELFTLIRFDVSMFKAINDTFGHDEGDKLLCAIAEFMTEKFGQSGLACRSNADNFAICLPFDVCTLPRFADLLTDAFCDYPLSYKLKFSFGGYIIDDMSLPVESMFDRALLAQRSIKGNYMKSYAFYDEAFLLELQNEQEIVNQMEKALDNDEFVVFFQPKCNLTDGKIIGAEALVRWNHPQKGLLKPGIFIPLFEKNGYIIKLDEYVLEQSCKAIRKWLDDGLHVVPISVNISRMNINNADFFNVPLQMAEKYNIPPEMLELEITESAFIQNSARFIEIIHELKRRGFRISIDDFGSGYSSLSSLKDIDADVLKLDLRFLSSTANREKGKQILSKVVQMADVLQLDIVAEGVEINEQATLLKDLGCVMGQGYYFYRPMPEAEFAKLLQKLTDENKKNEDNT